MRRQSSRRMGDAGWMALVVGLALCLAPGPAAMAQGSKAPVAGTAAPGRDEAHQLAYRFLERVGIEKITDQALVAQRKGIILILQRYHKTDQQAAEICDSFLMPEFRRRAPELIAKFVDILVRDFTVDELRAVLDGTDGPARRSAAAKANLLQPHFAQAGEEWGGQVGRDAYNKNIVALRKLGLDDIKGSPP